VPSRKNAAGGCKQCAVVRLEVWPSHLAIQDVKLMAENDDFDLLGFLGPKARTTELK
jgi:hypothetical protein